MAGGKLAVQDGLNRTNVDAATIPTINLTGGELELTPAGGAISWQAGMDLMGTDFDPKPGALLQTNIGNSTRPGNFSLNTGSMWDLDIASNTLVGGADWVDVNNGFGCPQRRPVQHPPHRRLHACDRRHGSHRSQPTRRRDADGSRGRQRPELWQPIVAAGGTEIHLTYVPEPSSMLLFGIGLAMFSASRRTRRASRSVAW